ncbi:MAG: nuclear transport factor 2 family protein [Thermodesulfobacteriota bacterium]
MSELSVSDRLEIQELLARYCHCIDRGRWERFPELFTEDCRLDMSQVMGLYEGRAGIQTFVDTLKPLGIFMRHLVTNVVIEGDGERAHVESYVVAVTGSEASPSRTTGFYDDEVVKQNGRWLLRRRTLALDVPKA